nr:DUF58 domain-containing protein [Flexivirga meconopsidis]
MPHPRGLIGVNRSAGQGDGTEFADIRPFQPGDRLRRIHWPVSARTGALHVHTSYAEQDTEVLLLLDASTDYESDEDSPTSLDLGVRASAALATHFLARGDRVGLEVVGGMTPARVPAAMGRLQTRRMLDTLARVERGTGGGFRRSAVRSRLRAGSLVMLISPLLGQVPLTVAAELAQRGLTVLIVDCLPPLTAQTDRLDELALRIRLLEREQEIRAIGRLGVPVTPWQGPGSLDQVLVHLGRRPVPRVVQR